MSSDCYNLVNKAMPNNDSYDFNTRDMTVNELHLSVGHTKNCHDYKCPDILHQYPNIARMLRIDVRRRLGLNYPLISSSDETQKDTQLSCKETPVLKYATSSLPRLYKDSEDKQTATDISDLMKVDQCGNHCKNDTSSSGIFSSACFETDTSTTFSSSADLTMRESFFGDQIKDVPHSRRIRLHNFKEKPSGKGNKDFILTKQKSKRPQEAPLSDTNSPPNKLYENDTIMGNDIENLSEQTPHPLQTNRLRRTITQQSQPLVSNGDADRDANVLDPACHFGSWLNVRKLGVDKQTNSTRVDGESKSPKYEMKQIPSQTGGSVKMLSPRSRSVKRKLTPKSVAVEETFSTKDNSQQAYLNAKALNLNDTVQPNIQIPTLKNKYKISYIKFNTNKKRDKEYGSDIFSCSTAPQEQKICQFPYANVYRKNKQPLNKTTLRLLNHHSLGNRTRELFGLRGSMTIRNDHGSKTDLRSEHKTSTFVDMSNCLSTPSISSISTADPETSNVNHVKQKLTEKSKQEASCKNLVHMKSVHRKRTSSMVQQLQSLQSQSNKPQTTNTEENKHINVKNSQRKIKTKIPTLKIRNVKKTQRPTSKSKTQKRKKSTRQANQHIQSQFLSPKSKPPMAIQTKSTTEKYSNSQILESSTKMSNTLNIYSQLISKEELSNSKEKTMQRSHPYLNKNKQPENQIPISKSPQSLSPICTTPTPTKSSNKVQTTRKQQYTPSLTSLSSKENLSSPKLIKSAFQISKSKTPQPKIPRCKTALLSKSPIKTKTKTEELVKSLIPLSTSIPNTTKPINSELQSSQSKTHRIQTATPRSQMLTKSPTTSTSQKSIVSIGSKRKPTPSKPNTPKPTKSALQMASSKTTMPQSPKPKTLVKPTRSQIKAQQSKKQQPAPSVTQLPSKSRCQRKSPTSPKHSKSRTHKPKTALEFQTNTPRQLTPQSTKQSEISLKLFQRKTSEPDKNQTTERLTDTTQDILLDASQVMLPESTPPGMVNGPYFVSHGVPSNVPNTTSQIITTMPVYPKPPTPKVNKRSSPSQNCLSSDQLPRGVKDIEQQTCITRISRDAPDVFDNVFQFGSKPEIQTINNTKNSPFDGVNKDSTKCALLNKTDEESSVVTKQGHPLAEQKIMKPTFGSGPAFTQVFGPKPLAFSTSSILPSVAGTGSQHDGTPFLFSSTAGCQGFDKFSSLARKDSPNTTTSFRGDSFSKYRG